MGLERGGRGSACRPGTECSRALETRRRRRCKARRAKPRCLRRCHLRPLRRHLGHSGRTSHRPSEAAHRPAGAAHRPAGAPDGPAEGTASARCRTASRTPEAAGTQGPHVLPGEGTHPVFHNALRCYDRLSRVIEGALGDVPGGWPGPSRRARHARSTGHCTIPDPPRVLTGERPGSKFGNAFRRDDPLVGEAGRQARGGV